MLYAMKILVGIGNPEKEYLETRHNVGWMFLDWLRKKFPVSSFQLSEKTNSEVAEGELNGEKVSLVKPLSHVNKTGDVVKKSLTAYRLPLTALIVIQDDLDIPFGKCKLSFDRNSGGHRGIESIKSALGTTAFYRIRIGLGTKALDKARAQSDEKRDTFVRDFVLKKFTPAERKQLDDIFAACEVRLLQILKTP